MKKAKVYVIICDSIVNGDLESDVWVFSTREKAMSKWCEWSDGARESLVDECGFVVGCDDEGSVHFYEDGEASQNSYGLYLTECELDPDE